MVVTYVHLLFYTSQKLSIIVTEIQTKTKMSNEDIYITGMFIGFLCGLLAGIVIANHLM